MFTKVVDSCSYEPVEKESCVYFSQEMVLITLLIWDNPSKVGHYGGQSNGLPNIATSLSSELVNVLSLEI